MLNQKCPGCGLWVGATASSVDLVFFLVNLKILS